MKEKLSKKTNVGALSVRNTRKNLPNCAQKGNKGITLVALIITIIVLLILAVVAIRQVAGDGIISHAKNARAEYEKAQNEELDMLSGYEVLLAQETGKAWKQEGTKVSRGNITLQIGEKVNYDEGYSASKTNTIDSNFKMKDLDWRVLGVNEKGQLELISTKPTIAANSSDTDSKLTLSGEQDWLNAETKLDTLCDDLYGKGEGAAGARSLKVEDVNKLGNYTPTAGTWYRYKYDATAKHLQYSTSSNYNPKTKEGIWTKYANTTSSYETFKEPGKAQINSTNTSGVAELQYTYYNYTVSSKIPDTLTTPDGIKMSELITQGVNNENTAASGTNQTQWMSSRCVNCYDYGAAFGVRELYGGCVNNSYLWFSLGSTVSPSFAVRPVVSLKSDVQIAKNAGIWTVSQSQEAN